MICNFMTTFPKGSGNLTKKATFFVEKIWMSLPKNTSFAPDFKNFVYRPNYEVEHKPKFHTIRQDLSNRWKVGMMIDFFINARTKKAFRFAPRVPVISLQKIVIKYGKHLDQHNKKVDVYIDNCFLGQYYFNKINPNGEDELIELAINDGFDSVDDFFNWFCDDFEGKIIHWTDLKY